MKKVLLLVLCSLQLTYLVWCTKNNIEIDNQTKNVDRMEFLNDSKKIRDGQCEIAGYLFNYKDDFAYYEWIKWEDLIDLWRVHSKKTLNKIKAMWYEEQLEEYVSKYWNLWLFDGTVRYFNVWYSFLKETIENLMELKDEEELWTIMLTSATSFYELWKPRMETFLDEYWNFINKNYESEEELMLAVSVGVSCWLEDKEWDNSEWDDSEFESWDIEENIN